MYRNNIDLQKQLSELNEIENKLVETLPKIQEALNFLKVEELHLKSLNMKHIKEPQPVSTSSSKRSAMSHNEINRQKIDLQLSESNAHDFDVETDSD